MCISLNQLLHCVNSLLPTGDKKEKVIRKKTSKREVSSPCLCLVNIHCDTESKCEKCAEHFKHIPSQNLEAMMIAWLPKQQGLFCNTALCKGQFVVQYVGKIQQAATENNEYVLVFNGKRLDAWGVGVHQYVNHSCAPNCEFTKWSDQHCMENVSLRALQDIPPGTELTVNYGKSRDPFECCCKKCRPCDVIAWWFGMVGTTHETKGLQWPSHKMDKKQWKEWIHCFLDKNRQTQMSRDFVRISCARHDKVQVHTISMMDTIDDLDPLWHCTGNWNKVQFLKNIVGNPNVIEFDWTWMPEAYLSEQLQDGFFKQVLPQLIQRLASNGCILLPLHIQILDRVLTSSKDESWFVTLLSLEQTKPLSPLLRASLELEASMGDKEYYDYMGKKKGQLDNCGVINLKEKLKANTIQNNDWIIRKFTESTKTHGVISDLKFVCISLSPTIQ